MSATTISSGPASPQGVGAGTVSLQARLRDRLIRVLALGLGPTIERPLQLDHVQRVLVLQLQRLGDSLVFTPALRAIRRRFPDARIDLLTNRVGEGLYAKCPHFERVFVDSSSKGAHWSNRHILHLLREIRAERYDIVVADVNQRSLWYGFVAMLSGAPQRIGFDEDGRGFLFTARVPVPPDSDFITCNMALAGQLGADPSDRALECYFDAADEGRVDALLGAMQTGGPLIAMHPGSNWQSKTWLPENWAALADALVARHGARVVLVGGPREREAVQEILALTRRAVTSLAGHTSLAELGALLSRCDLVVTTDSGPRHLAACTDRPTVTIMSSQDLPERWSFGWEREIVLRTDPPCSPCYQSYCSHRRCMTEISIEMALNACEAALAAVPSRRPRVTSAVEVRSTGSASTRA